MMKRVNKKVVFQTQQPVQQQPQIPIKKSKPSSEIAKQLSIDVLKSIEQQIIHSKLRIPSEPKELHFQTKPPQSKQKKLQQILSQKQAALQKLHKIEKQQQNVKKHIHSTQNIRNFKSQFTKQDFEELKKIKQTAQQFQKQLEVKTQIFQEKMKKYREEEKQLREKGKYQKQQERKEEIVNRLQHIEKRQESRQKKFEEDRQRLAEFKKKKWLHQQLNEKWKENQQQAQKRRQQLYEQMKNSHDINFQGIKEHERRYEEIIQRQKQQRNKKATQLANQFKNKSTLQYRNSKFMNLVLQQQEQKMQEQEERKNLHKNISEKRLQYAQKVRSEYKPKVTVSSRFKYEDKKLNELRSMSTEQVHKKGTQYMRTVHASIGSIDIEKSKVSLLNNKQKTFFKYPDYLTQNRMGRTINHSPTNQLTKIKQIMNKTNQSQQQKFLKAKLLAKQIQEKNKKNSKKLVQSINAKILILKELAQ